MIENNEISRNWGVDLQVQAATGVVIRGNRFIESHLEKWTGDQPRHRAVIFLQNVADATVEGNEVVNPGPEIGEELLVTDQVQNLRADRPFTNKKTER